MGDVALCLIDQGKTDEAKSWLDQLAAITPQDWRVTLGRAALAAKTGDAAKAEAGYRLAVQQAPTDAIRATITQKLGAAPCNRFQRPLPSRKRNPSSETKPAQSR